MNKQLFTERLDLIKEIVEEDHILYRFEVEPPVDKDEVGTLPFVLPETLHSFFTAYYSVVVIDYDIRDTLEDPFSEIVSGFFALDFDMLEELAEQLTLWLDSNRPAWNPDDYFPIMTVPTGDMIVLKKENDQVLYLNHEDESDIVLAERFDAYLALVCDIGFISNEEWQYEPFLDNRENIEQINRRLWSDA